MLEFEKKIADFIKAHGLFGPADRVLLAISGGADSIALLYVMRQLLTHKVLKVEFLCAHINHQLRGMEANLDEDFVTAEAAKLKLPLMTKRLDVRGFARGHKLSIETAARKLRIEALLDMARVNSCCCIATGHQKNDNAETILQRLARGTGFRGLGGIWPMRTFNPSTVSRSGRSNRNRIKFVRPLLCVTRNEIIEYLQQRNLTWRTDHTNADCTYRRNYIRHRLLPQLQQKCSGSIVEQLFGLSQSAQRFYGLVCCRAEDVWPKLTDSADDKVVMNLGNFVSEHPAVKVELIRQGLTAVGSGERDLTQKHYEKILRLAGQNVSGKKIELPGRFTVQREYGNLIFARVSIAVPATAKHTEVKIPGAIKFGGYSIKATILDAGCSTLRSATEDGSMLDTRRKTKSKIQFMEYFDLDKLKLPLFVRFREAGDKFWPLGLPAEKKVGKFLTTAKVTHKRYFKCK